MGVLIEGMEMPLPGTFNIVCIYSDGQVHMPSWGKGMTQTNGVKAIPVPPHGRLIDADALREVVKKHAAPSDAWVFSLIRTAPAVIHASKEE